MALADNYRPEDPGRHSGRPGETDGVKNKGGASGWRRATKTTMGSSGYNGEREKTLHLSVKEQQRWACKL